MKKAKMNLIDKAVAFINPQGAVDRLIARQKLTKFEYDAVKYYRDWETDRKSTRLNSSHRL